MTLFGACDSTLTAAPRPSVAFGHFGDQLATRLNFSLLIRCERESSRTPDPARFVIHVGMNFGTGAPTARASEATHSFRRSGSSSTMLYVPAGTAEASAATVALAASSRESDDQ